MSQTFERLSAWLLHEGKEEPAVQRLLLRTLLDDRNIAVLCLFWTQLCWTVLLAATMSWVACAGLLVDLALFALRWRQRTLYRDIDTASLGRVSPWIVGTIVASALLISVAVAWLIVAGPIYTLVLGSAVAPGLGAFYAILHGAFPRLSMVSFGSIDVALTAAVAANYDPKVALLAIAMPGGGVLYYLLIRRTRAALVDSMRAQHENWRRSMHDPLTGLGNRACLEGSLRARCADQSRGFTLMLIDLDGFKLVNDRLGHAAGDDVLKDVANTLRAIAADGDQICRIGGDEFVFLLRSADDLRSHSISQRIIAAVEVPIAIGCSQARVGASIGVATFPRDGFEPDSLLICADAALYRAKREGKGKVVVA